MRIQITLAGTDLGIFDPDEVTMEQAMQLEDKTGFSIGDLGTGMSRLSARSLQALVWLQKIRNGDPAADLHTNFTFGDLKIVDAPTVDPTEEVAAADLETLFEKSATSTSAS